jgi:hypothetical protein
LKSAWFFKWLYHRYCEKRKIEITIENRPDQGRKKPITSKEDRYLMNLIKKDHGKTCRQLASELNSSNGKSISPRTVCRWLFNTSYKSYTTKRNLIKNLVIVLFDYDLLKSILIGVLMNGKILFPHMNLISNLLIEKKRSFVHRLPSECDRPFNFQPRLHGGGGSLSVCGIMPTKGFGPFSFL